MSKLPIAGILILMLLVVSGYVASEPTDVTDEAAAEAPRCAREIPTSIITSSTESSRWESARARALTRGSCVGLPLR
jgi:hypothetical protein